VQAGQAIALLDDAAQRAAVDIAKADVAEADATLSQAGTLIGVARISLRQRRKLEALLVGARQTISRTMPLELIAAQPACC